MSDWRYSRTITSLLIAWDCARDRHTPRVIDGVIKCKFCGKDQSL